MKTLSRVNGLAHNPFKKISIHKMDIEQYEQYRFLGTVYEYMINYLSHEELATGQLDPDLVFQESTDYLLHQEIYLEEESNSSYANVFEDLEFDSYSEVTPYEQYDFLLYDKLHLIG